MYYLALGADAVLIGDQSSSEPSAAICPSTLVLETSKRTQTSHDIQAVKTKASIHQLYIKKKQRETTGHHTR